MPVINPNVRIFQSIGIPVQHLSFIGENDEAWVWTVKSSGIDNIVAFAEDPACPTPGGKSGAG